MSVDTNLSSAALPRAVEQAAAWLARQRLGALSDEDAVAFRIWLNASPDNARAWSSQEQLWARLDDVSDAPAILALREAVRMGARQQRLKRLAWQWGGALAASCLLGVFMWQWRPTATDVIRTQASSALLVPSAAQIKPLARVRDVATRVGERALVQLADGSTVTLNTDSAIHVDLAGAERRITLLRGEAYFEVAKDKDHPFVVSAGTHQVIAVGTAFNVRLQAQQLKVNLVEGKVRVERLPNPVATAAAATPDPILLEAGSSLLALSDGQERVESLNLERAVSWRSGKVVFEGDRLAEVVAELNLYSSQKLEIRDSELNDQLLSGVFDPAGGAELARALESYGMVRIIGQNSSAIVLGVPEKTDEKTD